MSSVAIWAQVTRGSSLSNLAFLCTSMSRPVAANLEHEMQLMEHEMQHEIAADDSTYSQDDFALIKCIRFRMHRHIYRAIHKYGEIKTISLKFKEPNPFDA